jgi:hypothetical protein
MLEDKNLKPLIRGIKPSPMKSNKVRKLDFKLAISRMLQTCIKS